MFRSILQIYAKGSDEAFEFYKKASLRLSANCFSVPAA
jgi:hypothetical protein